MGEGGRISLENGEMEVGSSQNDAVEPRERIFLVKVNEDGCLSVPPALVGKLGLEPEAELEMVANGGRIEIRPNIHSLARVYIEPTARCNLACSMCIRNTWKEPVGDMEPAVFDRLASQLRLYPWRCRQRPPLRDLELRQIRSFPGEGPALPIFTVSCVRRVLVT
jgi:hypothetical protein